MYSPILNPGEEIIRTSPDVIVKNVLFDAFLTNKRIIFVKKTDDIYEKKELVFPINLVRKFDPKADQAGTPIIEFSIQKPSGEAGSLILKFTQTGDYRYSERDDWIEKLKRTVSPEFVMQAQSPSFPPQERHIFNEPVRNTQAVNDRFPGQPYAPADYSNPQYGTIPPVNPRQDIFAKPQERPSAAPQNPYNRPPGYPPQAPQGMQMPQGQVREPAVKPLFCRYCGANIPKGSLFCPACGQKTQNAAPQNQDFAAPQPHNGGQRPPVPPVMPQVRPQAQDPYGQRGPVRPPAGPQNVPPGGGFSLADDPEYQSMQTRGRGKGPRLPASPKNAEKNQQKAYQKAEKQRIKEQKAAQKAHRKAMKKGGREDYDPYAYKESKIPGGLPKIIGGVVAVVVVIAVILFAVNSGMFSGTGTTTPSGTTAQADYTPGTTSSSETFGDWSYGIYYPGEWSGTITVNGVTTTITDDSGSRTIFGSLPSNVINNPSGAIVITATKLDSGSKDLEIELLNTKGIPTKITTGSDSDSITLTKSVS
ncbi:MAG: hypothetical protein PHV39_03800 [Methanomicrobium sp.]|nr:hypothetical protein [Methanomicrobium sp.]